MAEEVAQQSVVDAHQRNRFEIRAGDQLLGFTEYRRSGSLIAFLHTEISPEHEGKGLGSRLIAAVLDTSQRRDEAVLPFCPFVRGYIAKHPDSYLDLVPRDLRADFDLPATS